MDVDGNRKRFIEHTCRTETAKDSKPDHLAKNLTQSFVDLVSEVRYLDPITFQDVSFYGNDVEKLQLQISQEFALNCKKCFTFPLFTKNETYDRFELQTNNFVNSFFRIYFYGTNKRKVYLFLHQPDRRPFMETQKVVFESSSSYTIGYLVKSEERKTTFLTKQCKVYEDKDERGIKKVLYRDEVLYTCMINKTKELNLNRTDAYKECINENKLLDCQVTCYHPKMLQNYPTAERIEVSFILSRNEHVTIYEKKLDIFGYAVCMSSLLCFWFGFSAMGLYDFTNVEKIKRTFSVKEKSASG